MRRAWKLAIALTLGLPVPANAETYCIARSDCPAGGVHMATYAEARAAAAFGEAHVFLLGEGTFAGPLGVHEGERLAGAGRGKTLVTGGSTVGGHMSDLTLVLDDGHRDGAFADGGALERVDIDGSALTLPGVGVHGFGATYRHGRVEMAHGIALHSGTEASELVIDAPTGYVESDYGGSLRRSVVRAERGAVTDGRGLVIEDTAFHLRGDAPVGLHSESPMYPFTGTAHILARNVTIAGPGAGVGVDVEGNCNGGYEGPLLDQVAITGFDVHIRRKGLPDECLSEFEDGEVNVEVRRSAFDPQRIVSEGPGQLRFDPASPVATDLQLIDAEGGDLRPRWDSPLIDAGASASDADVRGLPRVHAPDVGAYEYQFAPPVAIAEAAPVGASGAFTFDARASYDVDGDPITFAWSFDDGESASGALVEHLFGTGRHEATVRVTDVTQRWSEATAVVGEDLPAEPAPAPEPTPEPTPATTSAPQSSPEATPTPVPAARPERSLRMTVRKRRLGGPGIRYRLSGAIVLPEGTPASRCAGGQVVIRVPTRPRRDRARRARIGGDCRFTMRVWIPRRYLGGRVWLYPMFRGAGGFPSFHGPRVTLRPR